MRLLYWLRSLFFGPSSPPDLADLVRRTIVDEHGIASPAIIAANLGMEIGTVVAECERLEVSGVLRRSSRQIVSPDPEEGIPSPYVRYELASRPGAA